MLAGFLLFAVNDTIGKWLIETYTVGQVILIRSVAALLVLAPFFRREPWRNILRPARPWTHVARVVLSTFEGACFYWAVTKLPLANVMTYYLAGPIYVTALSALLLREVVGMRRWAAVIVGFAGVVIALGPNAETLTWPALVAFVGSFAYALVLIATRSVADAGGVTLVGWQMVGSLALGAVMAPIGWVAPTSLDLGLLGLLGVGALVGHVCVNRALALAPASVVVPYQYTLIIWAIVFGYAVFGDVPSPALLAGAALIVLSGLFLFFSERSARVLPIAAAAPDVIIEPSDAVRERL